MSYRMQILGENSVFELGKCRPAYALAPNSIFHHTVFTAEVSENHMCKGMSPTHFPKLVTAGSSPVFSLSHALLDHVV